MAIKWKGGAADFLEPGVCKGGIEHRCVATTPGKAKDDNVAVCNLVALLVVWSLQGVMDLFVPPALELPLKKSMTLCHGRCVQGVTESSRACTWWLWIMQCCTLALLQPSNADVKFMWSCALLVQWNHQHVTTSKWEVNLRFVAFTKGYWLAIQLCYDRCFHASAFVTM